MSIFTQRQLSELVTAIMGRQEIPLKFVYFSELGAKRWDEVAKQRSSPSIMGINNIEAKLLNEKAGSFVLPLKGSGIVNVLDVGCGDGSSALPLMIALRHAGLNLRYIPIDISADVLKLAVATVKNNFSNMDIMPVVMDFEMGNFAELTYKLRKTGTTNLLLFLGSTLGNQSDQNRVLTNFRDSMITHDYLLIGIEFYNLYRKNTMIKQYDNDVVRDFVFTTAEYIGFKQSDGSFEVSFNEAKNQVEIYFRFAEERRIVVDSNEITFEIGDKVMLARAHKFSEWEMVKTLQETGFRIEIFTTSAERGYGLIMCQPSRYLT